MGFGQRLRNSTWTHSAWWAWSLHVVHQSIQSLEFARPPFSLLASPVCQWRRRAFGRCRSGSSLCFRHYTSVSDSSWSLRQSCQTRFHQSTDMGTAGGNVVLVDLSPLAALAHAGSRGLRNRAHPQAGAGVAHGGYASARFQPNPEHDRLAFAMQKVNGLDATAHNAFELVPMPPCFFYISLSLSLSFSVYLLSAEQTPPFAEPVSTSIHRIV
jgi:hypothetical protein